MRPSTYPEMTCHSVKKRGSVRLRQSLINMYWHIFEKKEMLQLYKKTNNILQKNHRPHSDHNLLIKGKRVYSVFLIMIMSVLAKIK